MRAPEHLGGGLDLAPEEVDLGRRGADLGAVVGEVGEEREGGGDRRAGGDDRLERGVVEVAGVQDQVDAGLGGQAGRLGAAAVGDGRGVERVGGVGDGAELVERPHRELAVGTGQRAGDVDLDPVGAVLDLLAGGAHHLVAVAHHVPRSRACPRRG